MRRRVHSLPSDNRRFTRKTTTLMLELSNSVRIEQPELEMKLTRDIQSLSTFKRDTAKLVRQMKKTKAPVVLTVNGKAELVVQDAESYQKLLEAKDRMEAIEGIQRGLESMKRNAGKPAEEFFREFFAEQRIPEE
jgi:prevent-host-death family protein